jgi:hypothetical protein
MNQDIIIIMNYSMKSYYSAYQESGNTILKSNFKMTSILLKSIKFLNISKIKRILIISWMDFLYMNQTIKIITNYHLKNY